MPVTQLRPNMDHWQERVDLAAAFRWTARLNLHEAVANHFSLAVNEDGTTRTVGTRVRFGYITPFFSYAFYQRGPWEVSIPVQLGFGSGSLVYDDLEGTTRTLDRTFVFLYEPAMTVQYRFLKYLAIGGGLGFRLVVTSSSLNERLNAPIYLFGLKVYFGDLYRDLRGE